MVKESLSRAGVVHALRSHYRTVPEALFELIDNSVDARFRDKTMTIAVSYDKDKVVVADYGGTGMGLLGMRKLLQWGAGDVHGEQDIGEYHVGGKAAIAFLGNSLRIRTKAFNEPHAYELNYERFGSADTFDEVIEREFLGRCPYPVPNGTGWTEITISNLRDGRYRLDGLQNRLGNTYRTLLKPVEGAGERLLIVNVRGKEVEPLKLPLAKDPNPIAIDVKLPHVGRVSGWAGRLERDRIEGDMHVPSGIRLVYNGRLIEDEMFFSWERSKGRGQFSAFIGEIEVGKGSGGMGLKVRPDKSAFLQGNDAWASFEKQINVWLDPLMSALGRLHEEKPVTKDEKRVLKDMLAALHDFLKDEQERSGKTSPNRAIEPGGRARPDGSDDGFTDSPSNLGRADVTPKSPPPTDPVGNLARLQRLLGKGLPRVTIDSLDPSVRATTIKSGAEVDEILVNNRFVMYPQARDVRLGIYLAEVVLRQILSSDDSLSTGVEAFNARHDDMVARFAKRIQVAAAGKVGSV
jgi:hypothetical protein